MIHKVIFFIFSLFIIQGILTYFQINDYRKTLSRLKKEGKVFVGQQKGRFSAGSIVIFVVNDKNEIANFKEMKGISVFNRFKTRKEFIGLSIDQLRNSIDEKSMSCSAKALKKALDSIS